MKAVVVVALAVSMLGCGGVTGMRQGWARDASLFAIEGCRDPFVLDDPAPVGGDGWQGAAGLDWKVQCGDAVYVCRGRLAGHGAGTKLEETKCKPSDGTEQVGDPSWQ